MQPLTRLDTAERHRPASRELTKECFVRLAYATHGSDLAESVSEVLNRCRPDPTDGGFSACALAFSTLLSSQGADAHHRRLLGSSGATLLTYRPELSLSNQFAGLGVLHYSLCNQHTRVRASRCRDALAGGDLPDPGALAPCGVPLPVGQDETLGSRRDQVKSGCTTTAAMALACADRSRSGRQLSAGRDSAGDRSL